MPQLKMLAAMENYIALHKNRYPGRLILSGMNLDNKFILLYFISGRSDTSRNRLLVQKGTTVKSVLADPDLETQNKELSLLVYPAMMELETSMGEYYAISSGNQTFDALESYDVTLKGLGTPLFLSDWPYENDAPHYTPRITAVAGKENECWFLDMFVSRKSAIGFDCDIEYYRFTNFRPGLGYCIHTYEGNGNPLPHFNRKPYLLPLEGDLETIANRYWQNLKNENSVALAAKEIDMSTGKSKTLCINKYEQVLSIK